MSKWDNPKPKKIGLLLQLGFDVDNLEIHLHEGFDVVDKFFLIEATHTHSGFYRKPLIWERVRDQVRFRKFLPKIVHLFVIDDALVYEGQMDSEIFELEGLQERLRWTKFLRWNNATRFFNETDLLGFGDCDEVASRDTINCLKHCPLESDPIDVGIWFPFGAIDQAYITDHPANNHPFTLGDPTFWSLKTAKALPMGYPSRNRGKSSAHVLGGMHMSNYGYLPFLLSKRLTQSETTLEIFQKEVEDFRKHSNV